MILSLRWLGCCAVVLVGCGDDGGGGPPPEPLTYGAIGPLVGDAGRGSFRFGAATAATQIEESVAESDWAVWTRPVAEGGMGKGRAFVGRVCRLADMRTDRIRERVGHGRGRRVRADAAVVRRNLRRHPEFPRPVSSVSRATGIP